MSTHSPVIEATLHDDVVHVEHYDDDTAAWEGQGYIANSSGQRTSRKPKPEAPIERVYDPDKMERPRTGCRRLVLILILLLFAGAAICGILFFTRNKKDDSNAQQLQNNQDDKEEELETRGEIGTTIKTFYPTYSYDEVIKVFYSFGPDDNALVDDWIGIFPAELITNSSSDFEDPSASLYLCGGTSPCSAVSNPGQLRFENASAQFSDVDDDEDTLSPWVWPLEPGQYQAYLLRGRPGDVNSTVTILAETASFQVEENIYIHQTLPNIRMAEVDIRVLLADDPAVGPKFVRLGFHDCAGGCNGCVDMTFSDNAGLDDPIDKLRPIVEKYENPTAGISRADIWALAALLGADVAQVRSEFKVDFSLEYIGRTNCEDRFDECFDKDNNLRECNATLGPHVHLPEASAGTDELFHFFSEEFQFTDQEVVALMGAHTLGRLSRENSGFDGPNGWVRDNQLLDNDYFIELVGGESGDSLEQIIDLAPPWARFELNNSDLVDMPDRFAWQAFPPAFNGDGLEEILMLNVDVSFDGSMRLLYRRVEVSNPAIGCPCPRT